MYICRKCGHVFEEADKATIVLNRFHGYTEYGYQDECPDCGSEDYVEAKQCEVCEEWFEPDYLTGGVCKECSMDAVCEDNLALFAVENYEMWCEFVADLKKRGIA